MKKHYVLITTLALCATGTQAHAFAQSTHKQIVIDAVEYMRLHPDTTAYDKLEAIANAAGYTVEQAADMIGQGAYDVDDFNDTFFCGNVTGLCAGSHFGDAGESIVRLTSYWHFHNHAHANDEHGNDIGGYDYRYLPIPGLIDHAAVSLVWNDYMDDGPGGMRAWWGEDSEGDTYNTTEKHYRLDSYSKKSMYKKFQTSPFQPIDNLGQYWYSQFIAQPSFQTLGFALHTTDVLSPPHVWATSDNNHGPWELWASFYYERENLNDADNGFALVTNALNNYTPVPANQTDIRSLITEGGAFAYANGGPVLHTIDHNQWVSVGRQVIPHAIAMVVHVLNHAVEQF